MLRPGLLSASRGTLNRELVDRCVITRPPVPAGRDWTLGTDGHLVPPPGSPPVIYDGPCLVGRQRLENRERIDGGRVVSRTRRDVRIRPDAPAIQEGDLLRITAVADPERAGLVGTERLCETSDPPTLHVQRVVRTYPADPPVRS